MCKKWDAFAVGVVIILACVVLSILSVYGYLDDPTKTNEMREAVK